MKEVPVLFMVRTWLKPDGGEKFVEWLDRKHMADMVAQPGILWLRRVNLEQVDEKGWTSLLLIYGFESRKALSRYLDSPKRNEFWQEIDALKDVHYSDRFFGSVDFSLDAEPTPTVPAQEAPTLT